MQKCINSDYVKTVTLSNLAKNFTVMGKINNVSADTMQRNMPQAEILFKAMNYNATQQLVKRKVLVLNVDETKIDKWHSKKIQGTGKFFYTNIGRRKKCYNMLVFALTDGTYEYPVHFEFLAEKKEKQDPSKLEIIKKIILQIIAEHPDQTIIVAADGAFASIEMLKWLLEQGIKAEMRMHSNRKVLFDGTQQNLKNIEKLQPRGKQKARTILAVWHDLILYITAQLRTDKHGTKTVVYQVSTHRAKPAEHVKFYKKRWPIEKMFRTIKQKFGLADCQARNLETQRNHVAAVLLAYSKIVAVQQKFKLKAPEDALRNVNLKNGAIFNYWSKMDISI